MTIFPRHIAFWISILASSLGVPLYASRSLAEKIRSILNDSLHSNWSRATYDASHHIAFLTTKIIRSHLRQRMQDQSVLQDFLLFYHKSIELYRRREKYPLP